MRHISKTIRIWFDNMHKFKILIKTKFDTIRW